VRITGITTGLAGVCSSIDSSGCPWGGLACAGPPTIEPWLSTCVPRIVIPHQRRHWLVHGIVDSFGDQLPRVGVGQRFRISTGLPEVNKIQTPPRPIPAELGLDPPPGTPMTARPIEAKTLPQDQQATIY
jgi:hypothetical protein